AFLPAAASEHRATAVQACSGQGGAAAPPTDRAWVAGDRASRQTPSGRCAALTPCVWATVRGRLRPYTRAAPLASPHEPIRSGHVSAPATFPHVVHRHRAGYGQAPYRRTLVNLLPSADPGEEAEGRRGCWRPSIPPPLLPVR